MQRLTRWLWLTVDVALAILMGALIILVFVNVVMRYGFSSGLRVTVELSRLLFVWVTMLASAVVLRYGDHLAVTEFSERFMPRLVPFLRRLAWLVILLSMAFFVYGAWRQTMITWRDISQLTGLPRGMFYLAGVVGGVLMGGIALVRLIGNPDFEQLRPPGEEGESR